MKKALPPHHHKFKPIEAHMFMVFLAYCLTIMLRQKLKAYLQPL
jgi:hypothetical protein